MRIDIGWIAPLVIALGLAACGGGGGGGGSGSVGGDAGAGPSAAAASDGFVTQVDSVIRTPNADVVAPSDVSAAQPTNDDAAAPVALARDG